jgi:transcriptional regulator ATRX
MGLGKTLSLIALIATASRYHQLQSRRVLILCPKSTVYNWVDEVIKWVGKTVPITLNFFEDNMTIDQKIERMELWYQKAWQQCSILFLGYESFRNLTILEKSALATNKKVMKNLDEYQQKIDKYLIDGPQLCVLDEGHIIKNLKCKGLSINDVTVKIDF